MKIRNKAVITALSFSFTLGLSGIGTVLAAGPASVELSSAQGFVILSKTGISTTGSTEVTGNIGVSPASATYITGFGLVLPAAGAFSTSALVNGKVYAPGYADPAPANLTVAIGDMEDAYTDAAGRTNPTATELGAGNIGGLTIAPGLYTWDTGVTIPTDVTLEGDANDVWIFQVAQNLTESASKQVILKGGALAKNVFWAVAGQTTVGTGALFSGTILDKTAIVFGTGAALNGRALAQTAVTLDSNSITIPSDSAAVAPPVNPPSSNLHDTTNSGAGSQVPPVPLVSSKANIASPFGEQVRTIVRKLRQGMSGSDVMILQEFLISEGKGRAAEDLARAHVTGYFGILTRRALAEFQVRAGITPALGNFGPITRSYVGTY